MMNKRIAYLIAFVLVLVADMAVIALFGIADNPLLYVLPLALMLYLGPGAAGAGTGVVAALGAEVFLGMHLGVLAAGTAAVAILLAAVSQFADIRPLCRRDGRHLGNALILLALGIAAYDALILIVSVFARAWYGMPFSGRLFLSLAASPAHILAVALSYAGCWLVFMAVIPSDDSHA